MVSPQVKGGCFNKCPDVAIYDHNNVFGLRGAELQP